MNGSDFRKVTLDAVQADAKELLAVAGGPVRVRHGSCSGNGDQA